MKFNVKQIYHTSHCGSTLMATLLQNCAPVYTEPSWTRSFFDPNSKPVFNRFMKEYDGSIIKFPSSLCNFSDHFPGEKVFLYRKLNRHLFKRKTQKSAEVKNPIKAIIRYAYDYNLKYCHPSLKEIDYDTDLKKMIFMWANRIQWMMDAKDVLWIESNDFFRNKKETMDKVCDHFKLPYITDFSLANVYVKGVGMNHSDVELKKVIPQMENARYLYPSFGIIEDEICNADKEILELIAWVKENMGFINSEYL